ncbi:MAG: TRAP transporter small permease [Pseudomonadota bacterium]
MALRRALDSLYLLSGRLGAAFLAGIALAIIAQVGGRFLGFTVDSTETAGFCMAASTFLGLAYTFKQGGHIRVTLLIRTFSANTRRIVELLCLAFTALGLVYFTYWTADFVYFSYVFDEISPGLMAIPFWIPRSGMLLGLVIMTIAVVDEFFLVLSGALPNYEVNAGSVFQPIDEAGQ